MPKYVVHYNGKFAYWSTIVDAPITKLMSRTDFEEYYRARYGSEGMKELPERLKRAEQNGTSGFPPFDMSFEQLAQCNRIGDDESALPFDKVIEYMSGPPDTR